MKFKFKDDVNLNEILKNFKEKDLSYEMESPPPFDEFITVDKATRKIIHYGYNGLILDWYNQGLLEMYPY